MKRTLLSVKEIAQALGVSSQSIRRAYWRGDIPAYRIIKILRFDLEPIQRIFCPSGCRGRTITQRAIAGQGRRRAQQKRPRSVTRGHYPQG